MNFRKPGALSHGLKKFCCTRKFEILTAVTVKIKIFQDVMPCSLVEIYEHSSKTLQYFCQTTPCHILKDGNLLLYQLKSLFQECTLLTQWYMQDSHQWSLSLEHLPHREPLLSMGNAMFYKHLLPTRQWGYNPESVEDSPILYLVAVNMKIIYYCTW